MDAVSRTHDWLFEQGYRLYLGYKPKGCLFHRWNEEQLGVFDIDVYRVRVCSKCWNIQAYHLVVGWCWADPAYYHAYKKRYQFEIDRPKLLFRNGEMQVIFPEFIVEHCRIYNVDEAIK